jgi:hypothetical protein
MAGSRLLRLRLLLLGVESSDLPWGWVAESADCAAGAATAACLT